MRGCRAIPSPTGKCPGGRSAVRRQAAPAALRADARGAGPSRLQPANAPAVDQPSAVERRPRPAAAMRAVPGHPLSNRQTPRRSISRPRSSGARGPPRRCAGAGPSRLQPANAPAVDQPSAVERRPRPAAPMRAVPGRPVSNRQTPRRSISRPPSSGARGPPRRCARCRAVPSATGKRPGGRSAVCGRAAPAALRADARGAGQLRLYRRPRRRSSGARAHFCAMTPVTAVGCDRPAAPASRRRSGAGVG